MSFSPKDLDQASMGQLSAAFSVALQGAGVSVNCAPALLRYALGHAAPTDQGGDTETDQRPFEYKAESISPMSIKSVRQQLWYLIGAQMRAGVDVYTCIRNVRSSCTDLGMPVSMNEVLGEWMEMMHQGRPIYEFFVEHVMPFDFEEGARMALVARLGTLGDVLFTESRRA